MPPFSRTLAPLKTPNALPSWMASLASLLIGALLQAEPVIQNQPVDQTVNEQDPVTFSVSATGSGTLSYQWQKDGVDIPGATSGSFSLASARPWHIGDYTVKVTDIEGSTSSNAASINLTGISSGIWKGLLSYYRLDGTTVDQGIYENHFVNTNAAPVVDRKGNSASAYSFNGTTAWMVSEKDLPITESSPRTFSFWMRREDRGTLGGNPTIIGHGLKSGTGNFFNLTLEGGAGKNLFIHGSWISSYTDLASPTPYEEWIHVALCSDGTAQGTYFYINGVPTPRTFDSGNYNTISTKLRISTASDSGGISNEDFFWWNAGFKGAMDEVRVYNRALSQEEVAALYALESQSSTQIVTQPQSASVQQGNAVSLNVEATGSGQLSYQWQKDGVDIPGATGATLTIAAFKPWHVGAYRVRVADSVDSVSSSPAQLSLDTTQPASLWQDLLLFLPFAGSNLDISASARSITQSNVGVGESPAGTPAGSATFNGTSSRMDFAPNLPNLDEMSLSLWIRPKTTNHYAHLFSDWDNALGRNVLLIYDHGRIHITSKESLSWTSEAFMTAENWYHITWSMGSNSLKLYVNGQLFATVNQTGSNAGYNLRSNGSNAGYNLRSNIGYFNYGSGGNWFNGLMSAFRIYGRALTDVEAQAIYAADAPFRTQTINFAAIPNKLTTDSVTLTATGGGSGNPITFAVTSGPGLISNGNILSFTTSGLVTITASQLGNANYLPAVNVSRTIKVTQTPEPDIAVSQAENILADDGNAFSFGRILVGEGGIPQSFIISNPGTADLENLSITLEGPAKSDFILSQLSVTRVPFGDSQSTFSVSFKPSGFGARNAILRILSNVVGAKSEFTINLSGIGGALVDYPEINIEQSEGASVPDGGFYDFGQIGRTVGTRTHTFTIRNLGSASLNGLKVTKSGADQSKFSIINQPIDSIEPGESTAFTVRVAGLALGLRTAVLRIESNDADEASYDITLIATGVAANLPSVTTSAASGITLDGATLNGSVKANNLERAVFFDYGLTTTYGSSVAATPATVTGNLTTNVSAAISNLQPHTKYNFRVRAVSNIGSASGANLTFTTPNIAPTAQDDVILALPSAKVIIRPLLNDSDPDGDPLSIAPDFTQPGKTVGTVAKVGSDLVFTPATGFTGGSLTYSVMDAFGGKSAPATVTLALAQCTLGDDVTIPADSSPYDLSVIANAPWTVIESIPWLSVEPLAPDATQVRLIPAPNPSKDSRAGTVIIGGKTHTVTQTGVLLAPVLTAPEVIPNAAISASYDLVIPTVNGPVTYTVSGVMPKGLTLSNLTGRISGSPTTPGTYTLTVLAKNVIGNSNPISFDITVLPFPISLAGNYSATIEDNEVLTDKLGGLMTMSVTATGGVTGTLKLGTGSHSFTGKLNTAVDPLAPDPDHAVLKTTIKRSGKPNVALTVNMNSGSTDLISGDVTLPGPEAISAALTGSKHVWNTAKNPASVYQGNYTMALSDKSGYVEGDGFLTFTVSPAGAVTYSGQLADGTVIAPLSATLWATGDVPLFALLYANKGSLNQSFNIDTGRNISGSPHWLKKPQAATVRAYASGVETTLSASGAGYAPSMAPSIAGPTGGVILAFSGGAIESVDQYSDLSQAFTVSAAFAATPDWLSPVQMKLTRIDVVKGTFTGSMTLKDLNPFNAALPMISRHVKFNGVLLPNAGMATGYFLLPSTIGPPVNTTTSPMTSGRVSISPN